MHIAFFLVLILFLFLLLCQDRLSDAVEVDLNRSSSEFHSENPSFESKDNYTEASSLATHPIEQNSDSNLPNSKTSVIRSSSTTKWRFIDPDRFGIVIRGTSRASIMDTIESDISLIQGIIERQLPDYEIEKIPNVLAVMIIFAFRLEMPLNLQMYRRLAYLHCALSKLFDHVGKYTPIHVYLWVQESSMLYLPSWINELFPEVMVVAIPSSSWTLPSDSGNIENWNYGHFHEDYFLMGRWRLTFAMSFVKAMGYQYVLQMDDDTFFMDNIEYNIVHRFQQANIIWGLRNRRFAEVAPITDGFPEITNYWMRTRNMSMPIGDLFDHINPQSLEGLTSYSWDRVHYGGCFQIMNVNFWHDEVVQNYVQMIIKLGADMEQRWQEQAIQNMVRMLFVPTQQVYIFEKNLIVHGKPSIENLGQLGCIPTYAALDIYSNTEIFHANADRVSFLVYLAGDTMMEILNFSWECEVYTKDFGPCDNPTLNAGSILVRHIAGYTKYFVRHFNLNSTLEQALFDRASMIWLDAVAKLRERQEQNDIQVDITPNKADQV